MIYSCYFKLRIKQLFRISKGIGVVRSLILFGLFYLGLYLLLKTNQGWALPIATILGLTFYHNERKDKDFLLLQTKHAISLFRIEYLLIGLPIVIIECLKAHFWAAGIITVAAVVLPGIKTIKWKSATIPMPFLYKGGIEYIRMFRLYGFLYLLLLLCTFVGARHGNITIRKVCLIIWGVVQSMAFASIPRRQELTFFLNYPTFQKYLIRSNAWNVAITFIPLITIVLIHSFVLEDIVFSACVMTGSIFYLWNVSMVRYLFPFTLPIALYQLIVLIPLFFYSCFIPFLLIPFALLNVVCFILLKNNTRQIWN